eukprot:Skav218029  [mRNA]  locus=scaffold214:240351:240899:+ [translate_table: standard]
MPRLVITLALLFSVVSAEEDRKLQKLVSCGVCKNVPESTCQWCSGDGGAASVGSVNSVGSCPAGMVSCGVCPCVRPETCAYCNGMGGPAAITAGDASSLVPSRALTLLLAPFAMGFA